MVVKVVGVLRVKGVQNEVLVRRGFEVWRRGQLDGEKAKNGLFSGSTSRYRASQVFKSAEEISLLM